MSAVNLTLNEGIARLAMAGEGKFNAGSLSDFNAALDSALDDDATQVLLITGSDKNFSQGLDLEYLMSIGDPEKAMAFVLDCMRMIGRLLVAPVPVVAAVNGHAFGLGAMMTLASDYKVMREDRGYFCLPEADLGMTLTWRMNALVCNKLSGNTLRDVLLAGKRVDAAEALAMGIIDGCSALEAIESKGVSLAAPMRGKQRAALAGLKRGMNWPILAAIESDAPEQTIREAQ
jgi:enoyl-CoA hydratase/carnithine racemase